MVNQVRPGSPEVEGEILPGRQDADGDRGPQIRRPQSEERGRRSVGRREDQERARLYYESQLDPRAATPARGHHGERAALVRQDSQGRIHERAGVQFNTLKNDNKNYHENHLEKVTTKIKISVVPRCLDTELR